MNDGTKDRLPPQRSNIRTGLFLLVTERVNDLRTWHYASHPWIVVLFFFFFSAIHYSYGRLVATALYHPCRPHTLSLYIQADRTTQGDLGFKLARTICTHIGYRAIYIYIYTRAYRVQGYIYMCVCVYLLHH